MKFLDTRMMLLFNSFGSCHYWTQGFVGGKDAISSAVDIAVRRMHSPRVGSEMQRFSDIKLGWFNDSWRKRCE